MGLQASLAVGLALITFDASRLTCNTPCADFRAAESLAWRVVKPEHLMSVTLCLILLMEDD